MPDPNELISLRPNEHPPAPSVPSTEELQFDRAETAPASTRVCVACKRATGPVYFQVQEKTVCESCARRIEGKLSQAAPAHTLLTASVYGVGAAAVGCAIYAGVAIVFHLQLALIAILVGYMVGRAVLYGSKGLGGRRQQILAALLTYFAVSSSYLVIVATHTAHPSKLILVYLLFAIAGPFMMVAKAPGAVLSLVIIFFGVWRAWKMTGRPKVSITGPFREGA